MKQVTPKTFDLVGLMGAFDSTVNHFLSVSGSDVHEPELLREFCECCQVSPVSPLAFAFFAFLKGVEHGKSIAAEQELN